MAEAEAAPDGTERLCRAIYGRGAKAADYLGGSEARMLHDAATVIEKASARCNAALRGTQMSDADLLTLVGDLIDERDTWLKLTEAAQAKLARVQKALE